MIPTYGQYAAVLKNLRLPCAYVDWNLLRVNANLTRMRARGLPIRLASKSLRSAFLIKKILAEIPGFSGVLAYSAREAAYLCDEGIDDIVIAYPTVEQRDICSLIPHIKNQRRVSFMVDCAEHVHVLQALALQAKATFSIAIDVDLSVNLPGLYFGVHRSSIRTDDDLKALIKIIDKANGLKLIGMMGYEAQFSVADQIPKRPFLGASVTMLKRISEDLVHRRRQRLSTLLKAHYGSLQFINGGGTATIESTIKDDCVTEISVGSALFGPASFDHFRDYKLQPAAGFALPVTRIPKPGYVTCHGGGYIASGPVEKTKAPQPFLPAGLKLVEREGAGEVQTPLRVPKHCLLHIGDPVLFRHAKAGELAEHFNEFHVILDQEVVAQARTYRGDGHAFL